MTKQLFATRTLIKNPVLRDRLHAFAVFTGIAIGGVSGIEMVIGGGFDTITPAFAFEASAPQEWYDRPIAPGMGWMTEPYIPASATLDVSQQFGDSYPIESYDAPAAGDLDGGPASGAYTPAHYESDALVSAADVPLTDAEIEAISNEGQRYIAEIDDLYAESHAAEAVARDMPADADAKLSGNALPL